MTVTHKNICACMNTPPHAHTHTDTHPIKEAQGRIWRCIPDVLVTCVSDLVFVPFLVVFTLKACDSHFGWQRNHSKHFRGGNGCTEGQKRYFLDCATQVLPAAKRTPYCGNAGSGEECSRKALELPLMQKARYLKLKSVTDCLND